VEVGEVQRHPQQPEEEHRRQGKLNHLQTQEEAVARTVEEEVKNLEEENLIMQDHTIIVDMVE
jgi:hypothetical protein